MEDDLRPLTLLPHHLDLLPSHPAADAGAQRFGGRLLGGEPGGKALRSILLPLAEGDLARRIHPREEPIAEAGDALLDPRDLNQVRTQACHHALVLFPASEESFSEPAAGFVHPSLHGVTSAGDGLVGAARTGAWWYPLEHSRLRQSQPLGIEAHDAGGTP